MRPVSGVQQKNGTPAASGIPFLLTRAIDGTRTRGFHLGKVALYQLSHYRMIHKHYLSASSTLENLSESDFISI